jgi:hypothetical protein
MNFSLCLCWLVQVASGHATGLTSCPVSLNKCLEDS